MVEISPEALDHTLVQFIRDHSVRAMLERVCLNIGLAMPSNLTKAAITAQRHLRMAELLATDEKLVSRREKLGEGNRLLSEAARRAIKESAQPSEIDPTTGKPDLDLVKRLVASFPYLMFDDPKRGLDKGLLFS
jgi:hypothetical protein